MSHARTLYLRSTRHTCDYARDTLSSLRAKPGGSPTLSKASNTDIRPPPSYASEIQSPDSAPHQVRRSQMIEIVLSRPHNRNYQNLFESSDTGDPTGMRCAVMRRFSGPRRQQHPSMATKWLRKQQPADLLGHSEVNEKIRLVHGPPRHVLGGHDGQPCAARKFGSESLQRESLRHGSFHSDAACAAPRSDIPLFNLGADLG